MQLLTRALLILCFIGIIQQAQSQETIKLYATKPTGSENWNWTEQENFSKLFNTQVVFNVVEPSLMLFQPPASIATGTAVIIAPGGGFQALSINSEGVEVAKWLNSKGVTCFVLKYRLAKTISDDPASEMMQKLADPKKFETENWPVIPLATNDGIAAMKYVRSHAAAYKINPNRIGFMGFSAGGTVTMSVAYNADEESRPDFIAPIYAAVVPSIGSNVPKKITPAFIAVAADDQLKLTSHSIDIYNRWIQANQPVELHVFEKGGHGFGMRKQWTPSDKWIDLFGEWLRQQGWLRPLNEDQWSAKLTPQQLEERKQTAENNFHQDWPSFNRFAAANKQLPSPSKNEKRVVFMGNSITEGWINMDPYFFEGKPFVNRGIGGQTTAQMLVRFKQDVIDLKASVVVILAGTNDIAGNTGPASIEIVQEHIISMAELAKASGVKVVLSSILPVYQYPWRPELKPAETIINLNNNLKNWAEKNAAIYLDYFSAMVDERNGLKSNLTFDGVHPNIEGYKLMEPLVEKAIAAALKMQ